MLVLIPAKMLTLALMAFCLFSSKTSLYKFYLLLKTRFGPISSKDVLDVSYGLWKSLKHCFGAQQWSSMEFHFQTKWFPLVSRSDRPGLLQDIQQPHLRNKISCHYGPNGLCRECSQRNSPFFLDPVINSEHTEGI